MMENILWGSNSSNTQEVNDENSNSIELLLRCEEASNSLKVNKRLGSNGITLEILKALRDFSTIDN